uniref:Uncharacterized protein n=1 Tax=Caenorhabditis japonica TaxID=281687 RepID=A0A8R1I8I2_CAEJA
MYIFFKPLHLSFIFPYSSSPSSSSSSSSSSSFHFLHCLAHFILFILSHLNPTCPAKKGFQLTYTCIIYTQSNVPLVARCETCGTLERRN